MKTIVITGASSGIGKATAKLFAEKGWNVAATMRQPENEKKLGSLKNVNLYQLDVTNQGSIQKATEQILNDYDSVNVVLNNAGYGLIGVFEAATSEQIHRQFETNVFGLMSVTKAFLPHFRNNKSGLFINVSSVGGFMTFPLTSLYHASKWAVEGFTESLSFEMSEIGVQVKLIEPAGVNTDFSGRSMDLALPKDTNEYQSLVERFRAVMSNPETSSSSASPAAIAEGIWSAATDEKDQLRYPVGGGEQMYEQRRKIGDEAFIKHIKEQFLS